MAPKPRQPQGPPPGPPLKAALSPPCDWPPQPSSGFHEPKPDQLDSKTIHDRGRALFRAVVSEQPPSAMSWLEEANFQMLRDHQCALVWVDACRHNKAFSKSWAFGCNSSKIRALEARCNHSYKHQSIAGVKEQGVYPSDKHCHGTPNSPGPSHWRLAGSRPATEQECTLPQTGVVPCQNTRCKQSPGPGCIGLVPRILAHIKKEFSGLPPLAVRKPNLAYTALKLPCPSDMSPEAGQPYRLHLLQALANSWGDPDMALLPFLQHGSRVSLATQPSMAGKEARPRAAAGSGNL